MRIIHGFEPAKLALSRQAGAEFYVIPPSLKLKLGEMFNTEDPERVVKHIVDEVRNKGDSALFDYSIKIDKVKLVSLEVERQQISDAYQKIEVELVSALKLAAERIRSFHTMQKDMFCNDIIRQDSGQLVRPLERVGVYAPGGTASYPSTVLMTAIPAKVAGVKEIILVTPPGSNGLVSTAVLFAADIAGVDRVFSVGGAQAIAALAFGTESIPRVDKICGPGNIFVTLAKKTVYGMVDIDGLQGPSEVVIIADEMANAEYCAADLLAQAEHDPLASAILITNSRRLADRVSQEIEQQLSGLNRKSIAAESLAGKGIIVVVADLDEAIELANLYAPEHLCLVCEGAASCVDRVTNAGCIFIGESSPVVLGDYVAGPNHALPTGGTARFSSPLNITDFVKLIDLVSISKSDFEQLGRAASIIARAEGLEAHARAVERRLEKD